VLTLALENCVRKVLVILLLAAVGGVGWWWSRRSGSETTSFRFTAVERGDLEAVIASTGTLEPVTLVSVGTQVSGQIAEVLADFNDEVREGQVLARLDTTVLRANLEDAQSSVRRAQAEVALAEADYTRISNLTAQNLLPQSELDQAQRSRAVTAASLESARAAIDRAARNLSYATILAPISGTIVARTVDAGQTVAASLSAPELFRIAADLSRMQILADVDESDISSIEPGQAARFTVQAYPDATFRGTVRQVRLQPSTSDNVVSYTVVVDVENPEAKLLPGMTATIEFLVDQVTDVLKVSNAALRFRPSEAMLAELFERRRREREASGENTAPRGDAPTGTRPQNGGSATAGGSRGPSNRPRLFILDEQGRLAMIPIEVGLSDGQMTEVRGPGLSEGQQVIVGVTSAAAASSSTNPFQPGTQSAPRGPRVPGGF
jgi:HlyD family secretion protein